MRKQVEGIVDSKQLMEFYTLLENSEYFAQAQVHPELGTVIWGDGADLDLDMLYAMFQDKLFQATKFKRLSGNQK